MSNVSVAVRGDCVGLRAAPTRKNSQVLSELAGRVTQHCRALAMHGMHVLMEVVTNVPSLLVPRCCGTCSARFPGLWYPVSRFGFTLHSSKESLYQSSSPPVANQGHKDVTTAPVFASPPSPSWKLVFYTRQIVGSTALQTILKCPHACCLISWPPIYIGR
jgi:hypothetical protein